MKLDKKEVQDLIDFANDIPTKYGMPLIHFINSKKESETKVEDVKEDKKPAK